MSGQRAAALRAAGYGLFGLASFLFGLVMTFPAEAAGGRLAQELERATRGAWSLRFAEASPWRLSGLRLARAVLRRQVAGGEARELPLATLGLRLQLWPLLWGRLGLVVDAEQPGGRLLAVAGVARDRHSGSLSLDLRDWDVGRGGWLEGLLPVPAAGRLGVQGEVNFASDVRKASAHLACRGARLSLGPGTLSGIGLPVIELGEVKFTAELKDGRLRLQDFQQAGGNLSLMGKFGLQLKDPVGLSPLESCLMVRVDPAFLASNPKLRGAVQIAEVQLKRDAEGYLHVPLAGSLATPRLSGGLCR